MSTGMSEVPHAEGPEGRSLSGDQSDLRAPMRRQRRQRRDGRQRYGAGVQWLSGMAAMVLLVLPFSLPTAYMIEKPGPAVDTVGALDGKDIISVEGRKTYETDSSLALTTVSVIGGPGRQPTGLEALLAWVDPVADMQPQEFYYPLGVTFEQRSRESNLQMTSSQVTAEVAAVKHLGIDFSMETRIVDFAESFNNGVLQANDAVVTVDGQRVSSVTEVQKAVQASKAGDDGGSVELGIVRDGKQMKVTAATKVSPDSGKPSLGVYIAEHPRFPFKVSYAIENIGGASAGTMMALGLIDKLTPGSLAGDTQVAGTGTIDVDGKVGPIAGVAQKIVGARKAGAEVFLTPEQNCPQLKGRVPDGIKAYSMRTLDDAVKILEALEQDKEPDAPRCGL
ncbi:S16 family serine protease [Pseudoglutamicibacter cumminsii]|uniref:endopeptidase La n=1 Tax=Pseudoglutamicibacter cumminsii TaxID=156979 RepID=A0AAP4C8R6_9MICC|nr:S16 family serine protease [Pseudoglutamicibacter cumminsii]MDK6275362.1 S16 family serine protease [Pseudoglutamicibacter cumminsii]